MEFAGWHAQLDPVDLKTLAQFYLLGDPSIHPVAVQVPQTALVQLKGLPGASKTVRAEASDAAVARTDRRRQSPAWGLRIGATQAVAARLPGRSLLDPCCGTKKGGLLTENLRTEKLSFKAESPAVPKGRLAKSMKAGAMAKLAAPKADFTLLPGPSGFPKSELRKSSRSSRRKSRERLSPDRDMRSR